MEKTLTVALILKPQGIRGEIKVKTLTDSAQDLSAFSHVFINGVEYKLLKVRPQGECAYITLRGIADRNAAELLRGKEVLVMREDAPPLPEGRYYLVDVIGCEVVTDSGNKLGRICEITPAKTDIFVIDTGKNRVPFVAADGVVKDIDVENRLVTVNEEKFNEVALLN